MARNPLRSEAEAFGYVIVAGAIALAVGLIGWAAGTGAGLAVLLGVAVGIPAGLYLGSEPGARGLPIWQRAGGARWRVLVLAVGSDPGRVLLEEVGYRARGRTPEVAVVVPAGPVARPRLDAALARLAAAGIAARGHVGAGELEGSLAAALAAFAADEVLVCTGSPDGVAWPARDAVARLRSACAVPVTHVVERPGEGP
ncbi:MAG: hypothetical protein IT201_10140 [Thermoleophilia bacterium]|nr:hypothetical protein [Thermoleophilia bacterium]